MIHRLKIAAHGDKEQKGFPPSSLQDLMPVGYRSNRETHPTGSRRPDFDDPHGARVLIETF